MSYDYDMTLSYKRAKDMCNVCRAAFEVHGGEMPATVKVAMLAAEAAAFSLMVAMEEAKVVEEEEGEESGAEAPHSDREAPHAEGEAKGGEA